MENAENPKPQTGGLKLMTVFIVVLALHVVVIGGISAYHIFKRGAGDSAGDVSQKDNTENTDAAKPDAGAEPLQADANAPATTATDAQVTDTQTPGQQAAPTAATPAGQTPAVTPQAPVAPVAPIAPAQQAKTPAPAVDNAVKTSQSEVTVNKGDSLYKIARQHGMSVDAIKKLNGLTNDNLKIGQKLKVETKVGAAPTAVAHAAAPAIKSTPTAATPAPAAAGNTVYTVNKGDTLTKIAKQFKTTPSAIMSANNMTDPRKLSIGAKLKIPAQQASAVTPVAPEKAASAKPAPTQSNDLVMAR